VFMGEFHHTVDDKGRLFVPQALRSGLGDGFVVTRGLDKALFLFPAAAWQQLAARMRELPLGRADARSVARFLFSGAQVADMDGKGRLLLMPHLRQHAGIDREAVWIGVGERVELWSAEAWAGYALTARDDFERMAEALVDAGL
jgi:MraZ protein